MEIKRVQFEGERCCYFCDTESDILFKLVNDKSHDIYACGKCLNDVVRFYAEHWRDDIQMIRRCDKDWTPHLGPNGGLK